MTIKKSQGQTFDKVGLHHPTPCFSHGQFYTGYSRATESNRLKIQVKDTTRQGKIDNGKTVTDNVVYREIFSCIAYVDFCKFITFVILFMFNKSNIN